MDNDTWHFRNSMVENWYKTWTIRLNFVKFREDFILHTLSFHVLYFYWISYLLECYILTCWWNELPHTLSNCSYKQVLLHSLCVFYCFLGLCIYWSYRIRLVYFLLSLGKKMPSAFVHYFVDEKTDRVVWLCWWLALANRAMSGCIMLIMYDHLVTFSVATSWFKGHLSVPSSCDTQIGTFLKTYIFL